MVFWSRPRKLRFTLTRKQSIEITAAMGDAQNEHVPGFNAVHNHVLCRGKAAAPDTKVFSAGTPQIGTAGQ